MHGVMYFWQVRPDKLAEHDAVVRETLRAERLRCPEVLLNLTFGPASDGTCVEIQVYANEASSQDFPARVKREDEELQRLWARYQDICEPDGWRTVHFDKLEFLDESFARRSSGVGYLGC